MRVHTCAHVYSFKSSGWVKDEQNHFSFSKGRSDFGSTFYLVPLNLDKNGKSTLLLGSIAYDKSDLYLVNLFGLGGTIHEL